MSIHVPASAGPELSTAMRVLIWFAHYPDLEMTGVEIGRKFGATSSDISKHLYYLRKAGVLETRREGREVVYRLGAIAREVIE